jgi:hypothetical protein
VIFSFIEGRKVTDILASLFGVSMVFSSGVAKSFGLFAMNEMQIDQFWMPAVIGGFALPLLVFMGYMLKRLPQPTAEDIALRNERVVLDGKGCVALFRKYAPILTLLFIGNFMLLVLRDIALHQETVQWAEAHRNTLATELGMVNKHRKVLKAYG